MVALSRLGSAATTPTVHDDAKHTGSGSIAVHAAASDPHAVYGALAQAETWAALQTFSAGIKTDTIAEKTAAAGVTIDGVKLKDGSVQVGVGGYILDSNGAYSIQPSGHTLHSPAAGGVTFGWGTHLYGAAIGETPAGLSATIAPIGGITRVAASSVALGLFAADDNTVAEGYLRFLFKASFTEYGRIKAVIRDSTPTSEDGAFLFQVVKAGALATVLGVEQYGIDVTGTATVTGAATLSSTLGVTGLLTASGAAAIVGASTINGNLRVGSAVAPTVALDVTGAALISSDVRVIGNIGVAIASPTRDVHVEYSSSSGDLSAVPAVEVSNTNTVGFSFTSFVMKSNAGGLVGQFFSDGSGNFLGGQPNIYFRTATNHHMIFGTNQLVRMLITPDGRVGIGTGTADPLANARLEVYGQITPAANQTGLYVSEGSPEVRRQVQWKAGDALVAGDKVMVLV